MRLLPLLVLASACATPARGAVGLGRVAQALWAPFGYVGGRVADLFEAVDLSVGVGPGADLDVHYGVNFLGAGHVRAWRAGLAGGGPALWHEATDQLGLFPFSLLGWPAVAAGRLARDERLAEHALRLTVAHRLGEQTAERTELLAAGRLVLADTARLWRHTTWGESLPVGAGLHVGLVGARAILKPLQLADFVVGFVGLDLDPWLARSPF